MASSGDHGEMNPFISYVDLFSSVILVLLLFVLIMFVNVGYYMQFNSKQSKVVVAPVVSEEAKKKEEPHKMVFVTQQDINKTVTTPSNNDVGENTLSKAADKSAPVDYKEADLLVAFKNNDYFIQKDTVVKLTQTMEKILKSNPNTIFTITVGDSKKILSATQAKQVSLGRVLGLKNTLEAIPTFKNKIKISYKQEEQNNFEFGYVKVNVK